jgi:hypothetical protein
MRRHEVEFVNDPGEIVAPEPLAKGEPVFGIVAEVGHKTRHANDQPTTK